MPEGIAERWGRRAVDRYASFLSTGHGFHAFEFALGLRLDAIQTLVDQELFQENYRAELIEFRSRPIMATGTVSWT
jgi:hypothetical protein